MKNKLKSQRKKIWRAVKGFENYEVSTLGQIRRIGISQGTSGGPLIPVPDKAGYIRVGLRRGGKQVWRGIHRIVAETFIPNPCHLLEVNHKNNIKSQCDVGNLEWRSRLGNSRHAVFAGAKGDGVGKLPSGKWRARYYPEPGKRKHLGCFGTKEEAISARQMVLQTVLNIL